MRLLLGFLAVLAILAVTAAFTRPGPEAFDRMLAEAIRTRIATTDVGTDGDAIGTIALVGCKLRPSDCIRLVREALDVRFDEGVFLTRVTVRGLDREARCLGAFGRFWCDRDVAGADDATAK